MQKYVPEKPSGEGFKTCVICGDQLTTERIRNIQLIRATSKSHTSKMDGFCSTHADWHAEVTYVQVLKLLFPPYNNCKLPRDYCYMQYMNNYHATLTVYFNSFYL